MIFKKHTLLWAAIIIFVLFPGKLLALEGRLIKLEVSDSADVEIMMKNFLTRYQFVLADDDSIPVLKVVATEEKEGPVSNCRVIYNINQMELIIPGMGQIYSSMGKSAYDYGPEADASRSALSLLKDYLSQDEQLMAALDKIAFYSYFEIPRPNNMIVERLDEIEHRIMDLVAMEDIGKDILQRLKSTEIKQVLFDSELRRLSKSVQSGYGRISQASVERLLSYAARSIRSIKCQYLLSNACDSSGEINFKKIGAVLIRVPVQNTQKLNIGNYGIYAVNQCLLYEKTKYHRGPKVARSLERIKKGGLKKYFVNKINFLDIMAVAYHPDERAVIIEKCDADAIINANNQGMITKPDIFTEGRVVLVPVVKSSNGS